MLFCRLNSLTLNFMFENCSLLTNVITWGLTFIWIFALYFISERKEMASLSIKEVGAILLVSLICQVAPILIVAIAWGFPLYTIPSTNDSKGVVLKHLGFGVLGSIVTAIFGFPIVQSLFFSDVSGDFQGFALVTTFLTGLLIGFVFAGIVSSIIAAFRKKKLGVVSTDKSST